VLLTNATKSTDTEVCDSTYKRQRLEMGPKFSSQLRLDNPEATTLFSSVPTGEGRDATEQ